MISLAQGLATTLARDGYSAAVINPRFIKPIDREMIERYARRVAAFVTFEDHVKMGGFGTAVVEALDELGISIPVVRIGWPDQFIEHGKVDQLRARYGVSVEAAYDQVLSLLAGRRRAALVAS
jgi:1-deoxy-D-xylulose-5-phosphate synthase